MSHNWVEVRIIPVTAEIEESDGTLRFYASDEAIEIADKDLMYMCLDCNAPPTKEGFYSACVGAPSQDQLSNG